MRKNTISNFIQKTWDILQDTKYSSILKWSQDGTSFFILNEQLLCSDVLPKYFKHSNFSSFIRQLNMYNFHKKKSNDNSMEFYHKLFRKDKRQLLIGIKRKPSEAQIQFGQELIRKMNKEPSKISSRQNSQSNQNVNQNFIPQIQQFKNKTFYETLQKNPFQNSHPTFIYSLWTNYGVPLYQITPVNMETNFYKHEGRKILTNIILKNPPSYSD